MKLRITVKMGTNKPRVIETMLDEQATAITHLRKLWEAEQTLNSLPGSRLRWHIDVLDEEVRDGGTV